MRHWLRLATRNWRTKPGRTAAIVLAVALGVGTIVTVTSIYASVETTIAEQIVDEWVGHSHLSIESPSGHWGSVDQDLAEEAALLDDVQQVTVRFKTRMWILLPATAGELPREVYSGRPGRVAIDVVGIDPAREYAFRSFKRLTGRRIGADDRGVMILEKRLADDLGLSLSDTVEVESNFDEPARQVEIVGLLEARRVAVFQKPTAYMPLRDVQDMRREPGKVSVIDCIAAEARPEVIEACAAQVRGLIRERRQGYLVTTATGKVNQLREARQATRLILLLFAFVALLTSFFIIITTMSMGMMERVRLLGTMRCVGMTRAQLAALVYAEVVPLGVVGALLGLPVGAALTRLAVAVVPHVDEFAQDIVWSRWGIGLAMTGGLITTLAGASAVLHQGARVSPMQAVNPQARGDRRGGVVAAAAFGMVLLLVHYLMIRHVEPARWFNALVAFCGTASLYGGYMLLAPALVVLVAAGAVEVTAPLLGVRRKLARDQVGRAPWRSAGVCWMLMVGLSLIVYFFVRGESLNRAWDFPARLAGTFVWTRHPVPRSRVNEVERIRGVRDTTPINDVVCKIKSRRTSLLSLLSSQSIFAAGDPDTFLSMAKLDFLQGDPDDARAKLARGGYLLLTPEASHSFGYNLGDKVPVTIADKTVEFEVAGVVRSPAMDIAVTYFQADSYMMLASACSVLGTLDDLRDRFGIDTVSMLLMNIDLPPGEVPADFEADAPPPRADRWVAEHLGPWRERLPLEKQLLERLQPALDAWLADSAARPPARLRSQLRRYRDALAEVSWQWHELTPAARWEIFREELVLGRVKAHINRPTAMTGSLRRLKQEIDEQIRRATMIISSIPMISLLVASLGVANLMMVNVNSRARQIAILRSVGSTKSQIARLVLVEAAVLGLLGSAVGVLLGFHSARSTNVLTSILIGIDVPWAVPWPRVIGAVALTWLICLTAGIGPALRAARGNIIEAMQAP